MAENSETGRKHLDQEATEWLLLVQEFPDDPDIQARFQTWLETDDQHRDVWQETAQAYGLIGEALCGDTEPYHPVVGMDADLVDHKRQDLSDANAIASHHTVGPDYSVWGKRRLVTCASVALLALSFILYVPSIVLNLEADFITHTGERRDVVLLDGSVVSLAPESAISVNFQEDRRIVRLLAGHAYFEVSPDTDRPFEVRTKGVTTTVLGTGFDERLDENGTVVAVRHGLVRVDYANGKQSSSETLEAGNWLHVRENGQVEKGDEAPERIGSWQMGTLVAYDRPVSEIVNTLRPYYNGIIVLTDDSLGNLRVTGIYNLQQPVDALKALAQAHQGLTIHTISPWLIVLNAS
jgi:transmembrane sensor